MPQTPCPDVHPLASRVPMPTNNPAKINIITLVVALVLASTSKKKMYILGANINPNKKTILSAADVHPDLSTKPPMMPLAPIILPLPNKYRLAASPITKPPTRPIIQSVSILFP